MMTWSAATRYRLLIEINNAIVKHTNRADLFNALASEIKKTVPYDRFSINLYDADKKLLSYFSTAEGISPEGISAYERPLAKGPIAKAVIRSKEPLIIPDLKKRNYWASVRAMLTAGLTASMAYPLITRGNVLGVLHFSFKEQPSKIEELSQFLTELTDVVAVAVDNMLAYSKLKEVNQSLVQQKQYLLERAEESYRPESFYFNSTVMIEVMRQVELIAATDASVLITGETGTGKDFIARHIHRLSSRRSGLFVKVNCPAFSSGLFESELFGHAKGAFTGAAGSRAGRFEMANDGTIFLDEIGELPIDLQAKLLHVLQDKCFERVGDNRPIEVNVRVIAATNRDMSQAIRKYKFRSDLFYRLNTVEVKLPPLRERREDVPGLVQWLNQLESRKANRSAPRYIPSAMEVLRRHHWPGNVRELKNLVKRMIIMHPGENISGEDVEILVESGQSNMGIREYSLATAERQHIETVLARTNGRLGGKRGAAALLRIPRTTLQYRLKKLGIDHKSFAPQ
ncbi:MAG: sigma 54-interacting transcriptional regulator [Desulfobacterales bacterium]|jgi:transcriptional regulator with GAF, ATPase, and Fis domain